MKIKELLEAPELGEPFKLTPEEIEAVPEVSARNIETRFKVGKVVFDQQKGLGATPNNQEVIYLGCALKLKPSHFLRLAASTDRAEDAKRFVKFIKEGAPLASPTLYVKINEEEWKSGEELRFEVTGHEGRGRMWAIDEVNGNVPVPVHIILRGGMRARHLSEKLFKDLRNVGIYAEGSSKYSKPAVWHFGRIFWDSKIIQ